MATIGTLAANLTLQTAAFNRNLKQATQAMQTQTAQMRRHMRNVERASRDLNRQVGQLRSGIAGLAGVLAVRQFQQWTQGALQMADALGNAADRVGLTTRALQEMRYAASQAGMDSRSLDVAMQRLTRRIGDAANGSGALAKTFQNMGISLRDEVTGGIRATEDVLYDFAEAVKNSGSSAEQLLATFQALDTEGAAFVNILRQGRGGLEAMAQEAHELGLVLEESVIRKGQQVKTAFDNLRGAFQTGFTRAIILEFAEAVDSTADSMRAARQAGEDFGRVVGRVTRVMAEAMMFAMRNARELAAILTALAGLKLAGMFIATASAVVRFSQALIVAARAGVIVDAIMSKSILGTLAKLAISLGLATAAWKAFGADVEVALDSVEDAVDLLNQELSGAVGGVAGATGEAKDAFKELRLELNPAQRAVEEYAKKIQIIEEYEQSNAAAMGAAAHVRELLTEAYRDQMDPMGAVIREIEEERYQLTLSDEEREIHVQLLELENRLRQQGIILTKQQRSELEREVRSLQKSRQAREEVKRAAEEQQRAFESIVNDTVRYGADLFADLFRETGSGWRDLWENMRQTMISALARMAAEAALRPIVVSVLGAMGVAGASGAAGLLGGGGGGLLGGGGITNLLGSAVRAGDWLGLGGITIGGMGAGSALATGAGAASLGVASGTTLTGAQALALSGPLGGYGGAAGGIAGAGGGVVGTGAAGAAATPGATAGTALSAYLAPVGAGFMLGSMFAPMLGLGRGGTAGVGALGGAAAGAAIGSIVPGVGTVIGGILGGIAGGAGGFLGFGGGDKDQEIQPVSAALGGSGLQTPFRSFYGSSTRFDASPLEQAVLQADSAIAAALSDRAIDQVRDYFNLAGTIRGERRDNKELSDKHFARFLRDAYNPVMRALGGEEAAAGFSRLAGGSDPQKVLEVAQQVGVFLGQLQEGTLFKPQEISEIEQAWQALGTRIEDAKGMAEQLGQSLAEVERQGKAAREAFVDDFNTSIARAISDLTGGTLAMEQAFKDLDRQQKQRLEDARTIGADIVEVERLNLLERLALLEQFGLAAGDFATETERATFGVARYGQGIAQFAVNLGTASARAAGQYRGLVDTLRTAAQDMLLGDTSVLSTAEQLELAREMFADLVTAASRGDAEAAAQLPQLGQRLLTLSRDFNASTEAYVQDFHSVRSALLEVSDASAQFADEQQAIADHAAQMAQAYTEAMQAVAQAISDGVILPDEVAEIESRFGAVTDAARLMGPAGVLFAEELANVAKMLEDGLLTDNEIAVLLDNVALFNATLVDGLLTGGEISAIRIRQDLINDVIRKGTISDEALEVLQAQARAVAVTIQHAVTDEALGSLRDHARTAADILRHDTIPRAVIEHLVTQADLIAGTIRGGVFNEETRKVLADRLADLRVLWRDGAPKPNDIKAIQAQVDLATAALVDGVVTNKEVKAIKDQIKLVRTAYADGVVTNAEIKTIQTQTNRFANELSKVPSAIDGVTVRIAASIKRLEDQAAKQAEAARKAGINQYVKGVGSNVGSLLGTSVSTPTRQSAGRSSDQWNRLYDTSRATLNLSSGKFSGWSHANEQRYNQRWIEQYAPALTGLAQQMRDLAGGKLPSLWMEAHTHEGVPTLRLRVGDKGLMTFTGGKLALDNVAASFTQSLKWALSDTLDGEVRKILRSIEFNKVGAQAGMTELARRLAEAGHIPGFASGGYHAGGLAMVGERGPELVDFATPSRIYSAPDTSRIMAGFANDNGSFRELIAEVRALKAENVELRRAMVEGFGDTVQAEGISGEAQRKELRELREEVEFLRADVKRQGVA